MYELQQLLYIEKYDLVFITETWLHGDITDGLLDPRGMYTVYRKDRSGSHHGGVAVLAHRNLCVAEVVIDDAFDRLEILCVDLLLVKDRLRFLVIYRPPYNDAVACGYVDLLVTCLEKYSSTEHTNFILGDFNCPRIDWENAYSPGDHINARIFDFMSSRGYSQFIDFATRGENILDLIFSDDDQIICSTNCCPPLGSSDHCLIEFQFVTSCKSVLNSTSDAHGVPKYNWYKGDYIAIEHYLQNIKWDTIIWNNPHALHAWSAFLDLHLTFMFYGLTPLFRHIRKTIPAKSVSSPQRKLFMGKISDHPGTTC